MKFPIAGPSGPYHPLQFRQPPFERDLEHARRAREHLEREPPRRHRRFGLRRSARKGGRY